MTRLAGQLAAFLRRDLLVEASYKANVLLGAVGAFAILTAFHFLGETVGRSPLVGDGGWFAFTVVGLAAAAPLHAALVQLARRVREAQLRGTLEALLATPLPPARLVLLSAAAPLLGSFARAAALLLGAALIFGLSLDRARLGAALLVFLLALASYGALGLLSAAFTLRWQRGDPVAAFLELVSVLLGGVFYPLEVLPAPLRAAAGWLPLTHALHGLRRALLHGATVDELAPVLRALALFALVLAPASLALFSWAVRRARRDGSLTHF